MKASAPPIYSHTGLRGIAAMYVVFFHLLLLENAFVHGSAVAQFFQWGSYAVDLFFILSGFILNWVYLSVSNSLDWPAYLRARAARILPLYYLTTLLCLLIMACGYFRYGGKYLGEYSLLLRRLFSNSILASGIVGGAGETFNRPAWSISVEFFCYLAIFPVLVCIKSFLANKAYALAALIILVCLLTHCLVLCYGAAPIPIYHWKWDFTWIMRGICGFSAGFFLCSIYLKSTSWKISSGLINLIILVFISICLLIRFNFFQPLVALYILPVLVFFTAMDKGIAANLLKARLFQWLGERSYSIYLWHWLFFEFYPSFSRLPILAYDIIAIALVLGISEISYRYFECPAREFIRKIGQNSNER